MVQKRSKKFMWALVSIAMLAALILIYFNIPFSLLRSDFDKQVLSQISNSNGPVELFTADEIQGLPVPVKKYFEACGYIDTPKMAYAKIIYKDVDFLLSADKPYSKIDYTQYNFVKKPSRLAFIDTNMFGIPFQGVDSYVNGVGGMKGVIAKTFVVFNETGSEMNTACLVTSLSECLIVPNIALQDYIKWESIDDTHAKATISYYGISASGVFTFADNGEMISFTTNDRWAVGVDGTKIQVPWRILLGDYRENKGIMQPTTFKAVWHYENGDSVYFDSKNPNIEYY